MANGKICDRCRRSYCCTGEPKDHCVAADYRDFAPDMYDGGAEAERLKRVEAKLDALGAMFSSPELEYIYQVLEHGASAPYPFNSGMSTADVLRQRIAAELERRGCGLHLSREERQLAWAREAQRLPR